jgi:uracil-DNA glycosylase family 4
LAGDRDSLKEVAAHVRTCQLCRLAKTRTHAVPGEGYTRAEVMFIGEGPGYREDQEGRPFVGPAGKFLNELLGLAGLERETVFIANVVKCRPPNNRDPMPDEIAACAPYLERQIALINPRVIVTLGRFSMARFFPGERISNIHGTARVVDGRLCVAMYHPAAGLHQASLADVIRDDFRKLAAFMSQARLMSKLVPAEAEARVAEAEEQREEVIHDVATGKVLETPAAYESSQPPYEGVVPERSQLPVVDVVEVEPQPSERTDATPGRKKSKKKDQSYKQMSFFDL